MPLRRLAVIGDVHGADERLAAALAAIAGLGVDATGGGDVNRCCALLRQYGVLTVRGNHDRWLARGAMRTAPRATPLASLAPEALDFISQLPPTRDLGTARGKALLCHGIGEYDLEKIGPYATEYSLRANAFVRAIADSGYRLMLNGHSHARTVHRTGGLTILNAGTLCEDEPGFLVVDFVAVFWQWHALGADGSALIEQQPLEG